MSEGISIEIKNSDLYIIRNSKHGATIEQAETVNKKIFKFLFKYKVFSKKRSNRDN